jgi:DNA-directed RNA polymerase subunit RPC12/RpoP
MLENGQAGIDCINCGNQEIVTTEDKSESLSKSLEWVAGDPVCPECGDRVMYEHYLD